MKAMEDFWAPFCIKKITVVFFPFSLCWYNHNSDGKLESKRDSYLANTENKKENAFKYDL